MYGIFEVTVKNMIHPLEDLTYVGSGSAIKKKKIIFKFGQIQFLNQFFKVLFFEGQYVSHLPLHAFPKFSPPVYYGGKGVSDLLFRPQFLVMPKMGYIMSFFSKINSTFRKI